MVGVNEGEIGCDVNPTSSELALHSESTHAAFCIQ